MIDRTVDPRGLLPCPMCSLDDSSDNAVQEAAVELHQVATPIGKMAYEVSCVCGVKGPRDLDGMQAIAAWNRRTPATPYGEIGELVSKMEKRAAFFDGIQTEFGAPTSDLDREAATALRAVGEREAELVKTLEPFALISIEGLVGKPGEREFVTITTQADYFHAARALLATRNTGGGDE